MGYSNKWIEVDTVPDPQNPGGVIGSINALFIGLKIKKVKHLCWYHVKAPDDETGL